jgi:hypothetical protein
MTPAEHANPIVQALNSLSVLDAHQGAAYREHSAAARAVLGEDISTKAMGLVADWSSKRTEGVLILTGNAGTGKTALAEIFCAATGVEAPKRDGLVEFRDPAVLVCKDLSGVGPRKRKAVIGRAAAIASGSPGLMLLCANEGVLRPLTEDEPALTKAVDDALVGVLGRDISDRTLVVNMNRQRWTGETVWVRLLDYVSAQERWAACEGCPAVEHCPMRRNAESLSSKDTREVLRQVLRLASSEEVAPLREILSILAYGITGGKTCHQVIDRYDRSGSQAFTAEEGYFHLLLGGGLPREKVDAIPVLRALTDLGIGDTADLEVDAWLREARSHRTPDSVRLAGEGPEGVDVLSQVAVGNQVITFADVGELITIDPDQDRVNEALADMLGRSGRTGYLQLWRRRLLFEAVDSLGGIGPALGRLSQMRTFDTLLTAVEQVEAEEEPGTLRNSLVKGLNYLGCGMAAVGGYMYLPDSGVTAARDLGSLLPAPPLVVATALPVERVHLRRRTFEFGDDLDTDEIELLLVACAPGADAEVTLRLTPSLFNVLMLAAEFRTPAGPDAPDLAAIELFYSQLGRDAAQPEKIQIASGGELKTVTAPDMKAAFDGRF